MKRILSSIYYVYILRCHDDTLYTGVTNDPPRRLIDHQTGVGGKYTRAHTGVEMLYLETCATKGDALRREIIIKKLRRARKLLLIGEYQKSINSRK